MKVIERPLLIALLVDMFFMIALPLNLFGGWIDAGFGFFDLFILLFIIDIIFEIGLLFMVSGRMYGKLIALCVSLLFIVFRFPFFPITPFLSLPISYLIVCVILIFNAKSKLHRIDVVRKSMQTH